MKWYETVILKTCKRLIILARFAEGVGADVRQWTGYQVREAIIKDKGDCYGSYTHSG